jgi:hypothetical protein
VDAPTVKAAAKAAAITQRLLKVRTPTDPMIATLRKG